MGKKDGEILAFVHFAVTEMRPVWLIWYAVFNTFEKVVTSASISDAYNDWYVASCFSDAKITAKEIEDCANSAYRRYIFNGPQYPFKICKEDCEGSGVGIAAPEPRIMFWFMTAWFLGFLLVLLAYFIYLHPNYHTGSYIKCTQKLYASKPYKLASICTFVVSLVIILVGIFLLIKYDEGVKQYIVILIFMVKESKNLVRNKSNGLDIESKKFVQLKISRGNVVMMVLNLFLKTNAHILDELEVQVMKAGLPRDVAGKAEERKEGCKAIFEWFPLSDRSIGNFLAMGDENSDQELLQNV